MNIKQITAAPLPGFPTGVVRVDYISEVDGAADWSMVCESGESRDWLVCIHGHGSSGDQLFTRADVRDSWVPIFQQAGLNLLTPNLRGNAWMSPAAASDLHSLIEHLRGAHQARKIVLVSGSMGGTSNLIFSALYPEDVDGVIAMCPATHLQGYLHWCRTESNHPVTLEIADAIERAYGGPYEAAGDVYDRHSAMRAVKRLTMPIYICHGSADPIIPVEEAQRLAAAMERSENFRYEEMPGGGHDDPLWKMETAMKWLLERVN